MSQWKPTTQIAMLTKAADVAALKAMDERKHDSNMSGAYLEKPKNRTLAVIPVGFVVTKCDPAPRSATCGPSDRFKIKGAQTKLPLPTKKQKNARKAK